MEKSGQVHDQAALAHGNNRLPVELEADWIRSSSGSVGEEKNLFLLPIFEPGTVQRFKFRLLSSTKKKCGAIKFFPI